MKFRAVDNELSKVTQINKVCIHSRGCSLTTAGSTSSISPAISDIRAPNFAPPWLASYAEQRCEQQGRSVELASASFRLRWTYF
jgi:hypothetical protein